MTEHHSGVTRTVVELEVSRTEDTIGLNFGHDTRRREAKDRFWAVSPSDGEAKEENEFLGGLTTRVQATEERR